MDGWNTLRQLIAIYGYGKTDEEVARMVAAVNKQLAVKEFATINDEKRLYADMVFAGRNLNARQRASLAKDILSFGRSPDSGLSIEEIAKFSGVSKATVNAVNKIDREGSPELRKPVRDGAVPATSADALVAKSKGEQKELLQDPAAVKAAAAAARAAKKAAKAEAAKAAMVAAMGGGGTAAVEDLAVVNEQTIRAAQLSALPRSVPEKAIGAGLETMATPAAISGPGIADLQMELRLWWKGKTVAERAALLRGLEDVMDAAWDACSPLAQETFLQRHMGELLAIRGPTTLEQRAAASGAVRGQMNGVAGNVALIEQCAKVKRKTRDFDTLRLCEMIEAR